MKTSLFPTALPPLILAIAAISQPIQAQTMRFPANSPAPYGALPNAAQVQWHEMESYAFLHFGLNTFTGKEWGYGDEPESLFNPTGFDADKMVGDLKAAGLKGVVIVAKHHDGFCLWPSKFTEHSVKNSPWKNGKGDVLRELSAACRKAKMKFGVYLSPWDRNRADYGTPSYVAYYHDQLREVLTNYGDIFMVWMDGANGGDGYYGGARETRSINARTYYGMEKIRSIVSELQPNAVIFGDERADVRWIGNEAGQSADTVWATIPGDAVTTPQTEQKLGKGVRLGGKWHPAEVDVSIRPGWFYHANEDSRVKTPQQLVDIYYNSVGRGADLNLNFPPNKLGHIGENDAKNAKEMRRILDATFKTNLVAKAKVTAEATRTGNFAPKNVLDSKRATFWAAPDDAKTATLIFETPQPITFDVVMLQELIELGQRLDRFSVDIWENGTWREVLKQQSVGYKRLDRLASPVTTSQVRLRLNGPVAPVLSSFGLYLQPVTLAPPKITRDKRGMLTLGEGRGTIRFTLDGTEPNPTSPRFDQPISLTGGATVRARVFSPQGEMGEIATQTFGPSKTNWKVIAATAQVGPASNAIDDNSRTLWHTHDGTAGEIAPPQSITVDMGETMNLKGFTYLPRQDGTPHGMVTAGRFEISTDGANWKEAWRGEFSNIVANPILQTLAFTAPQSARYFRFTGEKVAQLNHVAVAELGVVVQGPKGAEGSDMATLRKAKRILFLGDSITYGGAYITDFVTWLEKQGVQTEEINLGLPSETGADLTDSEQLETHIKPHGYPRPTISERLQRILDGTHPDVVFACYGMNDSLSLPQNDEGFARYTAAMQTLKTTVGKAGVRHFFVLTPPIHDAGPNQPQSAAETMLTRFSHWLLQQRQNNWKVIDLHGPMRIALDEARKTDANFRFAGDGVHPNRAGHWLMAQQMIAYFGGDAAQWPDADSIYGTGEPERKKRALIDQRMVLLRDAWLTKIGHKRPGLAVGMPLDQIEPQVAELDKSIRAHP